MISVPNMRIIMRDDWIEIEIGSMYAGFVLDFTFHPDGTVVQCEHGDSDTGPTKITFYEALSQIGDISGDNIQSLDDFNAAGGQL